MVKYVRNPIVVHLSSVHTPFDTRIFYKECKSLAKHGYIVHLIAQYDGEEFIDGIYLRGIYTAKGKIDRFTKTIPSLISKLKGYDKGTIFHFHDPELIPLGILLKLLGNTVIYDVHEDVPKSILTKEWIPEWARRIISGLMRIVEKFGGMVFDGIVTVVPTISARFKNNNDKVVEIRNYPKVSENFGVVSKKGGTGNYVIYIGSLTSVRGIPQLVDSIDKVGIDDLELWLGGSFGEIGLEQKLRQKVGWERTRFLGWLNRNQIQEYLSNSLAGVVVLKDTPSYREALPVKLFEYMLAGLPAIATDIPLWKEIIEKEYCGLVVPFDSPQKIANAIEWIYNNPLEAKKMGENGRRVVLEKYNWSLEESKLIKFYKEITSE